MLKKSQALQALKGLCFITLSCLLVACSSEGDDEWISYKTEEASQFLTDIGVRHSIRESNDTIRLLDDTHLFIPDYDRYGYDIVNIPDLSMVTNLYHVIIRDDAGYRIEMDSLYRLYRLDVLELRGWHMKEQIEAWSFRFPPHLEEFIAQDIELEDISLLETLPGSMEYVDLSYNNIEDATPLATSGVYFTRVNLSHNPVYRPSTEDIQTISLIL